MGKSERKKPLGRLGYRWQDNIKVGVKEIRWEDVAWIHLTQNMDTWWAFVNTGMNFRRHKMRGVSSVGEETLSSIRSMLCVVNYTYYQC
jgi:hypothetical protein